MPALQAVAVRAGKLIPTVLWTPAPAVTLTVGLIVIPAVVEVPEALDEILVKRKSAKEPVAADAGAKELSVKVEASPVAVVPEIVTLEEPVITDENVFAPAMV